MPRLPENASDATQLESEIITTEDFLDQWISPNHRLRQYDILQTALVSLPLEERTRNLIQRPPFTDAEPQNQVTFLLDVAYPDEHDQQKLFSAINYSEITPTEFALLLHVSQGMLNRQIALKQGMAYQTVKNHISALLEKLSKFKETDVFDRNIAVVTSFETGLLSNTLIFDFPGASLGQNREESLERYSSLSPRQLEILSLIYQGLSNKEIARELGISNQTVSNHNTVTFKKLEVYDRNQAALCRLSAKLLEEKVKSPYATRIDPLNQK